MTFNQDIKRMGFCCKYMDPDQTQKPKVLKEIQQNYTERQTTIAWLNRQSKADAEQRMLEIVEHNMNSMLNLVNYVGDLPDGRRMVRLGSNQIPAATQADWKYLWADPDNIRWMEQGFAKIGEAAQNKDVRISFHPGQFCVLASDKPDVVERSIDEFEYHATMARWMGRGKEFQDMKINVHISGRLGADGILAVLPRLSPEARNTITIENDEMCWGLDESLKLKDHLALVLDIHHHWVREGEYIQADDPRVEQVIESWRGVRPAMHYSYSSERNLPESFAHDQLGDMAVFLEQGCKKQKLRAHSDYFPNPVANAWALSFLDKIDIQCEAKAKNLAQAQLYSQALEQGIIKV